MNKIYQKFYDQKVFTLQESFKISKNKQVCKNTLNRLLGQNLIKRIRSGIYHIIPLDDKQFNPNKLEIASKIRPDAVLATNSALYARGLWKKEDTIYLASRYSSKIRIHETTYKIIKEPYNFGVERIPYNTGYSNIDLRVTDMERTIIDCLRTRSIKMEDIISLLRTNKPEIKAKTIIKYLEKYKKPILYNKMGFVLELCKGSLALTDEDLLEIHKKLSKKTFYIKEKGIRLLKPRYRYYRPWNIMIAEDLYDLAMQSKPTILNQ